MSQPEAFVYCWTDVKTNKLYIGKHRGSVDDGYVCSSKYFLSEYKKRPDEFIRTIIAVGNESDMISLETAILKSENARLSETYYNMHNNNGPGLFTLKGHAESTKLKLSKIAKGRSRSISSRLKQKESVTGEKNPFFGRNHTDENRKKMSEKKQGIYDGGKNPKAVKVEYDGLIFGTMKELKDGYGFTMRKIRKMIVSGEVRKV